MATSTLHMVTDESPTARRAKLIGGYLGILAVLILIGLPLFWILMTSFKAKGDIYTDPVNWLPPVWETENYSDATTRVPFWTYLRNVAQVGPERHAGGGVGVVFGFPHRRKPIDRVGINITLGFKRGHEDPKQRQANEDQDR